MKEKRILRYLIIKTVSDGNLPCPASTLDCSPCWSQVIRDKK